jgi:DNA-binding protein YbaB
MGRDIDEAWIDEAIERYQRIEAQLAELHRAAKDVAVTVRSPDGLVEVVVTADGTIRDVRIRGHARSDDQLSRAVRDAVTAAADAAAWARQKLHAETFGAYQPLR